MRLPTRARTASCHSLRVAALAAYAKFGAVEVRLRQRRRASSEVANVFGDFFSFAVCLAHWEMMRMLVFRFDVHDGHHQ